MKRTILPAILLISLSQPAIAHKCVLEGNSAVEITIYNSCKNDLASGLSGHTSTKDLDRAKELKLEEENAQLKDKILVLKKYLLDLLRFIE